MNTNFHNNTSTTMFIECYTHNINNASKYNSTFGTQMGWHDDSEKHWQTIFLFIFVIFKRCSIKKNSSVKIFAQLYNFLHDKMVVIKLHLSDDHE